MLFKLPVPSLILRWLLLGSNADGSRVASLKKVIDDVSAGILVDRMRLIFSCDATETLRNCEAPLLYLRATEDRLVPSSALNKIQQIRPDVQYHNIDGPHLLLQTQPEAAWEAILTFLDQLAVN